MDMKSIPIVNPVGKKDTDITDKVYFIRAFVLLFLSSLLPFILLFGYSGIILSFFISGLLSPIIVKVTDKIGHRVAKSFYGGFGQSSTTPRERLAVDIERAKYFRRLKRYDKGLRIVNRVLEKDEAFPEALLLKAQILLEGFGMHETAGGYLRRVMELVPDKSDKLYRWAAALSEKLKDSKSGGNNNDAI